MSCRSSDMCPSRHWILSFFDPLGGLACGLIPSFAESFFDHVALADGATLQMSLSNSCQDILVLLSQCLTSMIPINLVMQNWWRICRKSPMRFVCHSPVYSTSHFSNLGLSWSILCLMYSLIPQPCPLQGRWSCPRRGGTHPEWRTKMCCGGAYEYIWFEWHGVEMSTRSTTIANNFSRCGMYACDWGWSSHFVAS